MAGGAGRPNSGEPLAGAGRARAGVDPWVFGDRFRGSVVEGEGPARGAPAARRGGRDGWGENSEGGVVLGNKRTWEVHGCLVELLERLSSGERVRRTSSRRRRQWRAARRDGTRRGERPAFIGGLGVRG
jgi:hypothetical protein